jgi:hypothetical protein
MLNIREIYNWEIETDKGEIYTKGYKFDGEVIRISFLPTVDLYPRHDLVFTDQTKIKFVKRFCRTSIDWGSNVKECMHCVITDRFRFYRKSSSGQCLITESDYDYYV